MELANAALHRVACAAGLVLALTASPVRAADVTPAQYLEICDAADIPAAQSKAQSFGWQQVPDAELVEWRTDYERYNEVAVEASSWRNGTEPTVQISLWFARGDNAHRACTYTANDDAGLRQALIDRYGEVADATPELVYWQLGKTQVAYSRSGNVVYVNIGVYE